MKEQKATQEKKKTTKKVSKFAKKPAKPETVTTAVSEEASAIESLDNAETAVSNIFFYTNDKFFASLDNDEVIKLVVARYPGFAVTNTDAEIKVALVEMLKDEAFMRSVLKHFCITIYDFVKMMNKNYGMLFKGTFLKKVRALLLVYDN